MLLRHAVGAVVIAVGLVVGAASLRPAGQRSSQEAVLIDTQMERATSLVSAVDVLLLGDSSALMDVDAVLLSELLGGRRAESLATMGYVGPAGYARILDLYARRGLEPPVLLVLMHCTSLGLTESELGLEKFVLEGRNWERLSLFHAGRRVLFEDVILRAVSLPLPGKMGDLYGDARGLRDAIIETHGGMTDPYTFACPERSPPPLAYTLSGPVAARLPVLAEAISRANVKHTYLAITPAPECFAKAETEGKRAMLSRQVARALGGAIAELAAPGSLPDAMFATVTHLNSAGRGAYTRALAAEVSRTVYGAYGH